MKKINKLSDLIKYEYKEKFYFILLLLWTISPLIEYIFKEYLNLYYTFYFILSVRIIGLLGIFLYSVNLIKLFKNNKINIKLFIPEVLILALVFISFIASILSKNIFLSFFGESYRNEGLIVYIMYIGFLLLASIIKDFKYIKLIFKSMIISCLIITILPLFKNNFTYIEFSNVFRQFNHYGYYLMINIMLSLFMFIDSNKIIEKIFYLITYVFLIYLLIRNDTFGSYLSICITLILLFIYLFIKKYKRLSIVLLVMTFIFTSFLVSHYDIKIGERVNFESTKGILLKNILSFTKDVEKAIKKSGKSTDYIGTGRGLLWKEAFNYTLNHPIIGGGMESLKEYYSNKKIKYSDRPHNIILQTSSFIGIPGALIYIILIIYIAFKNLKIIDKNNIKIMIYFTAMCYFISSMFGNTMYYTSPYFAILLGFLISFIRNSENNNIKIVEN